MTRAALIPGISAAPGSDTPSRLDAAGSVAAADGTDTDADGLTDALERQLGADPTRADSDDDGLSDAYELLHLHTNPLAADTDADGIPDSIELALGTNPNDPDTAHTGRLDGPIGAASTTDRDADSDADGLTDALERILGSSLTNADTDGDGVTDGAEYHAHLNLLDPSDVHGLLAGPGTSGVGALSSGHVGAHPDDSHSGGHLTTGTGADLADDGGSHLPAL